MTRGMAVASGAARPGLTWNDDMVRRYAGVCPAVLFLNWASTS